MNIFINHEFDIICYFLLMFAINKIEVFGSCDASIDHECPDFVDPKIFYSGNKFPQGFPFRALETTPKEFYIETSKIPNAGLGVFAETFIKSHTWLGEYEGEFIPINTTCGYDKKYAWQIHSNGKLAYYVDGKDPRMSNWLRYINCARHSRELNVGQSKCYGRVYYRTIKDIYPGQELLVYYGDMYAEYLGIDIDNF